MERNAILAWYNILFTNVQREAGEMKFQFRHRENAEQNNAEQNNAAGKTRKLLILSALIMTPFLCLFVIYIAGVERIRAVF